ncbi:transcriptional regulator, AraC family [Paraglaciecola sp. T6c]|uniref:AraC family transcriptional regulator n=1 Tax=Pseudoalteromonas atlantica (strain T6c / ATCC BAA-1087) TaxID=3042615 RepID=UPI00005C7176|nr:AraC family transcriptional regulator [Paraglaciecola sp. T6c]ABG39346.1 transcriptional regulator, AraC family [Paraglaciecola sp. T6c]
MLIEQFETGSGGFVWQNLQPDALFSKVHFHVYAAFDMQIGAEWNGSQFVNHYNRIYYVESGVAELHFSDRVLIMEPGYLYLIPPYQLLSHSAQGKLGFKWVHFQASLDEGLDLFMLYGKPCRVKCTNPDATSTLFDELISAMQTMRPSAVLERQSLLLNLLRPFMHIFDDVPQQRKHLLHPALVSSLSVINQHVANPPSLIALAEAANMSPEHFSRKFKAAFNVSPKRYMVHKQIALAKQRLLLGADSIDRVAESCGFCDIFHFSRTFKKETGVTPSAFRKEYTIRAFPPKPS